MAYRPRALGPDPQAEDAAKLEIERKKELLRKAKLRTEKLIVAQGEILDGDPSKSYVWVNVNEHRQNAFAARGYVKCKKRILEGEEVNAITNAKIDQVRAVAEVDAKRLGLSGKAFDKHVDGEVKRVNPIRYVPRTSPAWEKDDGSFVRGDTVLYEIDKDEWEALHLVDEMRGAELADAPLQHFEDFADRFRRQGYDVPVNADVKRSVGGE